MPSVCKLVKQRNERFLPARRRSMAISGRTQTITAMSGGLRFNPTILLAEEIGIGHTTAPRVWKEHGLKLQVPFQALHRSKVR